VNHSDGSVDVNFHGLPPGIEILLSFSSVMRGMRFMPPLLIKILIGPRAASGREPDLRDTVN
jgi:hypothetical protein